MSIFRCGGIEMYAHGGKIKLTNTLESRLELLSGQVLINIIIPSILLLD